jgi:hypothetical protein
MRGRRSGRRRESDAVTAAPALVARALKSPSHSLDEASRHSLGHSFGHDLGRLRIHEGADAHAATRALGARAFTSGHDIVIGSSVAVAPEMRRRTLAHEAVHSVQQETAREHPPANLAHHRAAEHEARSIAAAVDRPRSGRLPITARVAPDIQFDLENPNRLAEVHRELFVAAPGSGSSLRPWVDATAGDRGTAGVIVDQAKRAIRAHVAANPMSVGGTVDPLIGEAGLDAEALDVDDRIIARFPMIPARATRDAITNAVRLLDRATTSGVDYLHQWLANRLIGWSDIELFAIAETDARFIAVLDELLADDPVGRYIRVMASRQSGFHTGEGASREVFVHPGAPTFVRRATLVHELVHLHSHPRYREWRDTTTSPRFFDEGLTEWLARRVMTADELAVGAAYNDRFDAIERLVASRVPEGDIARAYFSGEVWRIETQSAIARQEFASASGIATTATPREEFDASRTGPGLNEEVVRGAHYRFLNLGHDRVDPKPEHRAFFRTVKRAHIDPEPASRVRFVGHASTPGTREHNLELSRRRALAFYQLARDEGLPDSRLLNPRRPGHLGEGRPTLTERDAQTRAFNRRVEMFLTIDPTDASRRPAEEEAPER